MKAAEILIIEDEPALLRGLKDSFELQGFLVRSARDGQDGLRSALEKPPDLLLLDIMLPRLNGFEICQRLRREKFEIPIIMLTAKGQEEDIVRGLELGADDYVTKPFSVRQLLARVGALLRRRKSKDAEPFRFGDFVLDFAARRLRRGNTLVELTAKERQLLEFFAKNCGRALTRDQILDGVWGLDIVVNDRSVDRCVTTLRARIETDPHNPRHIQTIRDVGYRFEL